MQEVHGAEMCFTRSLRLAHADSKPALYPASSVRLLEQRTVRLPLDSIAVIGRHDGRLRSRVVAQTLAEDLAAMLARSRHLRVPRAEFVAPYAAADLTPEEIG